MWLRSGVVGVACLAVAMAGCSSSGGTRPSPSPSPSWSAAVSQYYLSLGDSYAAGYQPTGTRSGATTRNGFAYQAVTLAAAHGYHLTLANLGCSGATTTSVLTQQGCRTDFLGPGAAGYATTQVAAAEAFLRQHRGHVALVTVSLGGNDVTACRTSANPVGCVTTALATAEKNLGTLLSGLRAAGGSGVRIVGLTYPDVLLGGYLSPSTRSLATLSVTAFKSLINPGLQQVYRAAHASFVDVTAATGAYTPLTQTTTLAPYGTIPVAVAKVCSLTYSCQFGDIHPRTPGYALIARLVADQLPKR